MISLRKLLAPAIAGLVAASAVAWAAQTNYLGTVFIGDSTTPANQLKVNADGSITSAPTTGTGGVTTASVGISSAQALAAGARAYMLALQNVSASASMACAFGATAALNTAGSFQLGPGQMLTFNSTYVPQDAINCIASAASTPLTVMAK